MELGETAMAETLITSSAKNVCNKKNTCCFKEAKQPINFPPTVEISDLFKNTISS